MYTMSLLLSSGAGMLVGMEIGKRSTQRAASLFTLSMIGCVIFGLMMTASGLLMPDTITGWLCKSEFLFQQTRDYLQPMLIGAPAYMMAWGFATMVAVDGSPRLASVAVLVDNAVNLVLDIVFIKFLGWGIEGSSVATVIGHIVGTLIMCRHFFYKNSQLRFTFHFEGVGKQIKEIFSQGAPLALACVCLTLLLFSANTIILSSQGRAGIFAFSVCMNLLQIYNLFLTGTCRTVQSLGSIEIGKGDQASFRMVIRKSFTFISVAMAITCVAVFIFPQAVVKFFGADEEDLIIEGARAVRIFALSFVPYCYIYVLMIVYKLYNRDRMALFISLALSLTVIPVLWLMARYFPHNIWYSYLIAYGIEALLIVIIHVVCYTRFAYLAWWYFQALILRRKRPLQSVIFILDRCNLRCKHCSVYELSKPRCKTLKQIENELRYCYEQGSRFVDFEGGELYLWRDGDYTINDVIDLAHNIGFFSATITTNAQLPFAGSHADQVWVSMDGIDHWHDEIRGQGAFQRLEKNIAESGRKDICVNMVLNTLNKDSLIPTLEYVRNNPSIAAISVNFHTPFKGTEYLELDKTTRDELIDTLIRYKKAGYPIMNTVSGLKYMRKLNFSQYCWITNFIFSDGSKAPKCMGYTHDVCDHCGFSMGGEMAAVYHLKPDTLLSGLKLRLK